MQLLPDISAALLGVSVENERMTCHAFGARSMPRADQAGAFWRLEVVMDPDTVEECDRRLAHLVTERHGCRARKQWPAVMDLTERIAKLFELRCELRDQDHSYRRTRG